MPIPEIDEYMQGEQLIFKLETHSAQYHINMQTMHSKWNRLTMAEKNAMHDILGVKLKSTWSGLDWEQAREKVLQYLQLHEGNDGDY